VRWLATLVEPRGGAELRFSRWTRVGTASVALVAFVAFALTSLFGKENLALHKPTGMSAMHPGSGAAPGGLTDGVITGAPYGIHSAVGDAPWVQTDLLAVYLLDTVKIYNRGDAFFDEGLPMTLQLSLDGAHYVDVETRTKPFTQTAPWVAKLHGTPGRFVRVRGTRGKYVTLSELEAFGRPQR
jgi:hypothetical protein